MTTKKTTAIKPVLDMNIVSAAIELRKQVIAASAQDILALANANLTNNKITMADGSVVLRSPSMLDALENALSVYGRTRARKLSELGVTGTDIITRVTINVGGKLKTRTYVPQPRTNGWNVTFSEVVDKAVLASLTDAEVRRYFPTHAPTKPVTKLTKPVAKAPAKDGANAQGRGSDKKPAAKPPVKKPAAKPPVKKPAQAKAPAAQADKPADNK